jgi:hypothetical protein
MKRMTERREIHTTSPSKNSSAQCTGLSMPTTHQEKSGPEPCRPDKDQQKNRNKTGDLNPTRWSVPAIQASGEAKWKDCKFKASLGYTVRTYLKKRS